MTACSADSCDVIRQWRELEHRGVEMVICVMFSFSGSYVAVVGGGGWSEGEEAELAIWCEERESNVEEHSRKGGGTEVENKGEKSRGENTRGDVGKVKGVNRKNTSERRDVWHGRSWLGAQVSSLALVSGPGAQRTPRDPTASLACATALIYGIFDLHSLPISPIYS